MKKVLAMILALSAATGMSVTALAETSTPESKPETPTASTIIVEKDADGLDLNSGAALLPGRTYYFPLRYTAGGETEAKDLTADQYKNYKFSFANEAGKRAIESMKLEKHKSQYSLAITTKAGWPTVMEDVRFKVTVTDTQNTAEKIEMKDLSFQVGYPEISEDSLRNPEYVVVDPSAPVITEDQFTDLNDRNDGNEVIFAYGDWEFAVKVKGLKTLNLVSNNDEIAKIVEKFENQEFKFVSFPASPEFRTNGTLTLDVSNETEDYEGKFFVYRYVNGKLSKVDATIDEEGNLLKIATKQLGQFVVTNKEIKDGTIVDNSQNDSSNNGGSNGGSGEQNPETGAHDFAGLAVAMATVGGLGLAAAKSKKNK